MASSLRLYLTTFKLHVPSPHHHHHTICPYSFIFLHNIVTTWQPRGSSGPREASPWKQFLLRVPLASPSSELGGPPFM